MERVLHVYCHGLIHRHFTKPLHTDMTCGCYRLIRRGYKKPLDKDSLWNLNRQDTSAVIVPEFERQWRLQCAKVNKYGQANRDVT